MQATQLRERRLQDPRFANLPRCRCGMPRCRGLLFDFDDSDSDEEEEGDVCVKAEEDSDDDGNGFADFAMEDAAE